jgi:ribonuclease Z
MIGPQQMKLTFLGTSSAVPTQLRNVSSLALSLTPYTGGSEVWLFDVGEGTQRQMQHVSHLSPLKVTIIFITHLHGDHVRKRR